MEKEADNKYSNQMWDEFYSWERKIHIQPKTGIFASYDLYLCDEILKDYLPKSPTDKKLTICEIGSGDGKLLKKISNMFGYEPTGLEYAQEGVNQWLANGVNTVLCDAFNDEQMGKFENYFDIVYSYGFIEHILPPEKAIKQHLKILKEGGILVLQIPRLKWFNYLKFKLFRPDLIPLHNIDLMEQEVLSAEAARFPELEELVCKNYGTFKIRLPINSRGFKYYLLKVLSLPEYILNPLFRFIFWKKWFETRLGSPSIIYIGRKK